MQALSRGLSIGVTRVVIPPSTVRLSIGMTQVVIPPCMHIRLSIGMTQVVFPPCMHSPVAYRGNPPPGGHSTTHSQGFIHVHSSTYSWSPTIHYLATAIAACYPGMHMLIQYCQIQVPWLLFIRRCSSSIGGITRPAPVVGPSANQLCHHCWHVIVAVTRPRFIGVGTTGALLLYTRYALPHSALSQLAEASKSPYLPTGLCGFPWHKKDQPHLQMIQLHP